MSAVKVVLLLVLAFAACSTLAPSARADSFGYYATGGFQFDSQAVSGNASGICFGECLPWGSLVAVDFSFSALVSNYQESSSCSSGQCETETTGNFGPGDFSAELTVGVPPQIFYLKSGLLGGSFDSHVCTGQCGTYRAESELSLDFQGSWNNDWYSTGTIQLECFQKDGCVAADGAGSLNTYTPEPCTLALLASGMPWFGFGIRRKLS
jgi:hypothetical protein